MQLVLGAAGAAVGSLIPGIGAGIGWTIGSTIGGMLSKPDKQVSAQPIMDLRVPGTEDGRPLPWIRGALRVAPDWAWHSDRRAIPNTTSSGGGKGGGGTPESENTTYTYEMDALFLLTINGGIGIAEVYIANELIWRTDSGAAAGTIAASNASERWDRLTVYTGAADQLPDPDYEAWVDANVGAGLAPAYRGRLTVFVKGLKLGTSGQVPQIEFTAVVDGTEGPRITYYTGGITSTTLHAFAGYSPNHGEVWVDDPSFNSGGAIDRYGVYNLASASWSSVLMQSPWHELGSNHNGPRAIVVSEWDLIYIQARDPSGLGFYNTLVYQLSTHAYLGNFKDTINDGEQFEHAIIGVDTDNGRLLIYSSLSGLALWSAVSGLPGGIIATYGNHQPGIDVGAIVDDDGNFWLSETVTQSFWRLNTGGRTVIAADADGSSTGQIRFDPTRNCFYYWSDVPSGGEYLKKMDCATAIMSRVNASPYPTTGDFPYYGRFQFAEDRDQVIAVKPSTSATEVYLIDPTDGSIDETFDVSQGGNGVVSIVMEVAYSPGVLWWPASTTGIGELVFNLITVDCPTVQAVQEAICIRGGLTASQVNVAPLSAITREVCAFPWSQISGAREPTQRMMSGYYYETVMSGGKVKFVPRGASEIATIPYMDLGAFLSGEGGEEEPLPLRLINDVEMPAHTLVKFINLSNNYQDGAEKSDRLISASAITINVLDLAMGLLPAEGKGIADTAQRDRAATLFSARIWLLRSDYPTLEPTDPIIVVGKDGSQYRFRAVNMIDRFPLVGLDIVLDDPNVLSNQGITTTDYESQTTVTAPANTVMRLIDAPILQDADNSAGLYVLAKGDRTPYPGSAIFDSSNGIDYTRVATMSASGIFGTCTTTLGDWTGPRIIDELNSVTVNLGDGTLESSTRTLVLNSQEVNAIKIGSELIQFILATLVSPGVYALTRLLRGCRGTEWAMTGHAAGEQCALLTRTALRRIAITNAQIGANRYYKGVTLGRALSSAAAQQFTTSIAGLKPFAMVDLRMARDGSNNATITAQDRSRLGVRMIGPLGISVPPDEAVAAYEWDIYDDDTFTTLVNTLASSTPSVAYSAAAQTADGLTPGNPISVRAYKLSSVVGRGYPLEHTA